MSDFNSPPSPGPIETTNRKGALAAFVIGVGLIVFNHWSAINSQCYYPFIIYFCPLLAMIGLGGIIDPRIMDAMGAEGKSYPMRFKVLGIAFALAGGVFALYLAKFVYVMGS